MKNATHYLLGGCIFLLLLVTCRVIGLTTGFLTNPVLAIVVAGFLAVAWQWQGRPLNSWTALVQPRERDWRWIFPAPLLIAFLLAWIYRKGIVLPVHDPIAIPSLAVFLAANVLPAKAFALGSFAHTYPPGAPALYAYALSVISPVTGLAAMKLANLLALLLIPAAWGWMWQRCFKLPFSRRCWIPICYLSFLGLERTLGFALPFAGKNALLFGICAAPCMIIAIIESCQRRFQWVLSAVALFGLTLVNYSLLHLVIAVIGGYMLMELWQRRLSFVVIARLVALLGITGLLIWSFLHDAISDPRAGSLQFTPLAGTARLVKDFFSRMPASIIYNDSDFGIDQPYYRGVIFMIGVVLACWISSSATSSRIKSALGAAIAAMLLVLAFAFGIVPAAITLDYARWILWPVQAMAFALTLSLLISAIGSSVRTVQVLAGLASTVICIYGVTELYRDSKVYRRVVNNQAISRQWLVSTANFLEFKANERPCVLIGDSSLTGDHLSVIQFDRPYSYIETVSRCRFANGSWIDRGDSDARQWDGFPTPARLRQLTTTGYVMLIGRPKRIDAYLARIHDSEPAMAWTPIRTDMHSTIYVPTMHP